MAKKTSFISSNTFFFIQEVGKYAKLIDEITYNSQKVFSAVPFYDFSVK